ncbi:MAG TPA: hypothetical protein VGI10_02895 [Polyangiaceae bacterium]|jgi:hypothetical protein
MIRRALLLLTLVAALGCGGRAQRNEEGGGAAGGSAGAQAGSGGLADMARVPKNHRPASTLCPEQRAAVTPTPQNSGPCASDTCECRQDSDCTQGTNGRCGIPEPIAGVWCTYDGCASDDDCPNATPCHCRSSAASWEADYCATNSNCRIDADCGPGGYCSPSYCDLSYHCHSPADACTDDSDCTEPAGCNFDTTIQGFICALCGPPPV